MQHSITVSASVLVYLQLEYLVYQHDQLATNPLFQLPLTFALPPLLTLLGSHSTAVQENAAGVLGNTCLCHETQTHLACYAVAAAAVAESLKIAVLRVLVRVKCVKCMQPNAETNQKPAANYFTVLYSSREHETVQTSSTPYVL